MKKNPPIINEYTGKEPPQFRSNPYKYDVLYTPEGQWKYPGQVTKIPNRNITMKGVNYPVLGVDDLGNEQMMQPGMDYTFPGQTVTEYPQMQEGGTKMYDKRADYEASLKNKSWGTPQEMYNDSLNLHKAYQFQKANAIETAESKAQAGKRDPITGNKYDVKGDRTSINTFPFKGMWDWKNRVGDDYKTSTDLERGYPGMNNKLIADYYNQLKFKGNTYNGLHSSPDLYHENIRPTEMYYDGIAQSPVYKKPVYDPSAKSAEKLPQEVAEYLQRKEINLPTSQQEQELILPKNTPINDTAGKRIAWRKDPTTKKMVPVITNTNQPVSQGKRIYNKDVPSSTGAIPGDFVPDYGTATSFEIGGWLDEMKLGGTPSSLQQFKAKRGKTSKNIQSSINKLFLRNHTLYGFSGKNIYDPKAKFSSGGGWLDNLT